MYDQQPVQIYSKQFGGKERALSRTATAIPYRALLPKDSEDLIVAGRRLSVEEMALGWCALCRRAWRWEKPLVHHRWNSLWSPR
jgi:hypothetical protein